MFYVRLRKLPYFLGSSHSASSSYFAQFATLGSIMTPWDRAHRIYIILNLMHCGVPEGVRGARKPGQTHSRNTSESNSTPSPVPSLPPV